MDGRIIVPGRHIALKAVRCASRGHCQTLLEAGDKVYEFQPTMLHRKVMVVDGVWSSIGSIHFTSHSMKKNAEGNVAIYDRAFARQVKDVVAADIARRGPVTLEQWKQRNLCQRIRECDFGIYKNLF